MKKYISKKTKKKISEALKGKPKSKEHRRKLSLSHKGKIPWIKGKKHTKESNEKNRIAHLGKRPSRETRKKLSKSLKGRKFSYEHKKKLKINNSHYWLGKKNYKQNEKLKGRPSWNKGLTGEKSHSWRGGKSFEPYSVDWTNSLRISIRERDKYTCQLCGEKQGDIVFLVHHIDYNKKNCNPSNLITLCRSCHTKTNFNRDYWFKYFS